MHPINPYEAPQSELAPLTVQNGSPRHYPPVILTIFEAQIACVVFLWLSRGIRVAHELHSMLDTSVSCLRSMLVLLTMYLTIVAIRYRIAWLLLVEWFLFAIPLLIAGLMVLATK